MIATVPDQSLRERALRSLGQLPPFSPILNRLLASLAREDVSFIQIADLIEKDTILAGNVLKLVNSALYGRRASVNSVRHAVSLLGVNKLRNAALGMSVSRMWNQVQVPTGWSMARFNLHGVATGLLADVMSQSAPVAYAEGAFAAGLFHDLGRLLIAIGTPEAHEQIANMVAHGGARYECEMEILGFTHAELSAEALVQWNLPEPIRTAVRAHHCAEQPRSRDELIKLAFVVGAADDYVNALGYSIDSRIAGSLDDATAGLRALRLGDTLRLLLETFGPELEQLRALF